MIIEIKGPVTKVQVQKAIEQLSGTGNKEGLRKHFGNLKRGLDGFKYQKQLRGEWI